MIRTMFTTTDLIYIFPIIAKCIEYNVSMQITNHMEENDIFSSRQYGLRKNYPTRYIPNVRPL